MTPANDKIISKISKLLKLSSSPNPNEASLALLKAYEIMEEYNLTLSDIKEGDEEPVDQESWGEFGRIPRWILIIIHPLAEAYHCSVYRYSLPNGKFTYKVVGKTTHRMIVLSLMDYLENTINTMAKKASKGKGREWANQYRLGVAMDLKARLKDMQVNVNLEESTEKGIILNKDQKDISRFLQSIGIELVTKNRYTPVNGKGFEEGVKDGSKISLSSQITPNQKYLN